MTAKSLRTCTTHSMVSPSNFPSGQPRFTSSATTIFITGGVTSSLLYSSDSRRTVPSSRMRSASRLLAVALSAPLAAPLAARSAVSSASRCSAMPSNWSWHLQTYQLWPALQQWHQSESLAHPLLRSCGMQARIQQTCCA